VLVNTEKKTDIDTQAPLQKTAKTKTKAAASRALSSSSSFSSSSSSSTEQKHQHLMAERRTVCEREFLEINSQFRRVVYHQSLPLALCFRHIFRRCLFSVHHRNQLLLTQLKQIKYMCGLLRGLWVVAGSEWVKECVKTKALVSEEPFEISADNKVCCVCMCVGPICVCVCVVCVCVCMVCVVPICVCVCVCVCCVVLESGV
jgi:hypothetical protein